MKISVLIFFCEIFTKILAIYNSGSSCSVKTVFINQYSTSTDNAKPVINTVLQTLLKKHDNACFEIHVFNKNFTETFFLRLHLEDIWLDYQIKKDYNFTIPKLNVKCICDCPGLHDKCNRNHEENSHCDGSEHGKKFVSCFKKYIVGHTSTGCFINQDIAETCCTATLFADNNPEKFLAIYLDSPTTLVKLTYELTDSSGKLIPNPNITNEKIIQSITTVPSSFWAYINPRTRQLMVNDRINHVDEYRLDKLGWFKITTDNQVNTVSAFNARNALHVNVQNCKDDKYTYSFDAIGLNAINGRNSEFGQPAEKFYQSEIEKVSIGYRSVQIHPHTENLILINSNLQFAADVILHGKSGTFKSFKGIIILDEFGNHVLKLDIVGGFGELHVSVVDHNKNSTLIFEKYFTVSAKNSEFNEKRFRLPNYKCLYQTVCLSNTAGMIITHCDLVPCKEKLFEGPRKNNVPVFSGNDPAYTKIRSWFDGIFDFISDLKDLYKIAIAIIFFIIFMLIMTCVFKCLLLPLIRTKCKRRKCDQIDGIFPIFQVRHAKTRNDSLKALISENYAYDGSK